MLKQYLKELTKHSFLNINYYFRISSSKQHNGLRRWTIDRKATLHIVFSLLLMDKQQIENS